MLYVASFVQDECDHVDCERLNTIRHCCFRLSVCYLSLPEYLALVCMRYWFSVPVAKHCCWASAAVYWPKEIHRQCCKWFTTDISRGSFKFEFGREFLIVIDVDFHLPSENSVAGLPLLPSAQYALTFFSCST